MFRDKRGYTLIELIVVVLLIGLVLTLTAPRLRDSLLSDDLKSAARRLIGITNDLRNEAIRE
ncbi:MAG TPA: prepilin-type N-terminal cleavage/methylation domain-containing protein, partial [Deltaproteobacteria bacterium]|nr:prepilin-type N-terminal cleavage/methylation domain-containing protein [Deltaproteobacteria bacterium]